MATRVQLPRAAWPDTLALAQAYARLGRRVVPLCAPVVDADGVILVRGDGSGWPACTHDLRGVQCARNKKTGAGAGKIPLAALTPRGVLDASRDPDQLAVWWAEIGTPLNYGLAMGDGWVAIDIDSYKTGDAGWDEIVALCAVAGVAPAALRDTATLLTGGGGLHRLFEDPTPGGIGQAPPRRPDGARIYGIDVRSTNGYIVGPGSLHESGRFYVAELEHDPLDGARVLPAPPALLALLGGAAAAPAGGGGDLLAQLRAARAARGAGPLPVVEQEGGEPPALPDGIVHAVGGPVHALADAPDAATGRVLEGNRKRTIVSHAGSMWMRGVTEDAILAAMVTLDEASFDPPLGAREVARLCGTVFKKPRRGRTLALEQRGGAAAAAPADPAAAPGAAAPPADAPAAADGPVAPPPPPGGDGGDGGDGPPRREIPRGFQRGDAPELAERLLGVLRGESPRPVVYDLGAFWRYDPRRGVYDAVTGARVVATVAAFAGLPTLDARGRAAPLKLSTPAIRGVAELAATLADTAAAAAFGEAPRGFFETARDGVAFADGFVVIEDSGAVRRLPHDPAHRARFALPFPFRPLPANAAPAPGAPSATRAWDAFFEAVFARATDAKQDRARRIELLLQLVGASLFGIATRYAVAGVLLGEGANGKSTFLRQIAHLFPPGAVTSVAPQHWGDRFRVAGLARALLNYVSELPENDMMASTVFKGIVAGDETTAEHKFKEPFRFRPRAGHLFAANQLPATRDTTRGFWRRWEVVLFDREFKKSERDPGVDAALGRELEGLAALVVAHTARLVRDNGYVACPSSQRALASWRLDVDQVAQFVAERCETEAALRENDRANGKPEQTHRSGLADLYTAYCAWARQTGHATLSSSSLGGRLRQLGFDRRTKLARLYALVPRDNPTAATHPKDDPEDFDDVAGDGSLVH